MLKSWSVSVLSQWLTLFRTLLDFLDFQIVQSQCVNIVTNLSDSYQPSQSRYVAARILGFLAQKMKNQFSTSFIQKAKKLCQDHDVEIRKIMVEEVLEEICVSLPPEIVEFEFLEKIMELIYDSEINVKIQSIILIFKVVNCFSEEAKSERIIVFYFEILSSANYEVIKVLASLIGQIVFNMEKQIKNNPEYVENVLKTMKKYAQHQSSEIRKNFPYNLPAILKSLGKSYFEQFEQLYIKMILKDSETSIREICVAILPEIIKIIGSQETKKFLISAIMKLNEEKHKNILPEIIRTIQISVEELQKYSQTVQNQILQQQNQLFSQILSQLIKLLMFLQKQQVWQLQQSILIVFAKTYDYFCIKEINEQLIPVIIQLMKQESMIIVKKQCVENIMKWLSINYNMQKRIQIITQIRNDLLGSISVPSTYQNRLIYIAFTYECCNLFSRSLISNLNLVGEVLYLANDSVPNVRRKLAELLPSFEQSIVPLDTSLINRLNEITNKLKNDNDIDVQKTIIKSIQIIQNQQTFNEQSQQKLFKKDQEKLNKEQLLQMKEIQEQDNQKKKQIEDFDQIKLDLKAKGKPTKQNTSKLSAQQKNNQAATPNAKTIANNDQQKKTQQKNSKSLTQANMQPVQNKKPTPSQFSQNQQQKQK